MERMAPRLFALPEFGTFGASGTAGQNFLDGTDFQNVNLALIEEVSIREGVNLQLPREALNLFNHSNPNLPDALQPRRTFALPMGHTPRTTSSLLPPSASVINNSPPDNRHYGLDVLDFVSWNRQVVPIQNQQIR